MQTSARLRPILAWQIVAAILLTIYGGCWRSGSTHFVPGSLSAEDSHDLMVETLAKIASRTPDENIFVGDMLARTTRQTLQQMPPDAPVLRRWLKTYQLSKLELLLGNETEAMQLMGSAYELIRDNPNQIKPEILQQFYFDTAVNYLRWGETQNCCRQNMPGSCILPIEGAAVHNNREGSQRAIEWLTALLKSTSPDQDMHISSRWLLNLAYMTLGDYPESVPGEYLIPGIGAVEHEAAPWTNVASQAGLATYSLAGGAIADDFDNDGDIDVVVSSSDPRESLQIFWNDGRGKFQQGTEQARLSGILGGLNMTQTDYNNDGLIDLFVMRGGWLAKAGQHPNSLLRNNGDGTFTDVTITAGLSLPQLPTQTATWCDYDLDGDLDVYIGNEAASDLPAPAQLFRNNGDGTFEDVAAQAGVTNGLLAKAVTCGDYDGDRYPDLYVSNYRGPNRLYRNLGNGKFQDVAASLQVEGPEASFPTWFCDVNNDGNLDLFVAAYSGGIAEVAKSLLGKPFDRVATLPRLYINQGDGTFSDQAEAWGLVDPTHPMGANFGDIDNNGYVDFYLGTGWPEYHELMPNMLYRNTSQSFEDITNSARVGHLQKGHAVAMADFDSDGDLDIFEQMGGFVPGDSYYDVLFQNPGSEGNWLNVKLVGTTSNRVGIGARICVRLADGSTPNAIYRHVNSGGSFGANPLTQHIGLGPADTIEQVEVFWPVTGKTDIYRDVPPNSKVVITEGEPAIEIR